MRLVAMKHRFMVLWVVVAAAIVVQAPVRAQPGDDWRSDWSTRRGFAMQVDTEGYNLPTAIAFVPQPGAGPKDPLYFVTELRGTIKVVTNDRSVVTFAQGFFTIRPVPALNRAPSVEVGLTGICLEPHRGYVFATFAYHDEQGFLRNNVIRFQSRPGTFSLAPESSMDFRDIFVNDQSTTSHQIGPCQASRDHLYVAVGDGGQPNQSRVRTSTLGKILRMTLDGRALPDNPFFSASAPESATSYVWASGLRNPFGLLLVGPQLFAVDNGNGIDRVVEIRKGEDYLWAGSDAGIGTKAIAVISPAVGVTGLAHAPGGSRNFPAGLYFNYSGDPFTLARGRPPQVTHFGYSLSEHKVMSAPETFVRYRGREVQTLASLALGPDGLYIVPLFPSAGGATRILKVVPDPTQSYPFYLEGDLDAVRLLGDKGCTHCHALQDRPNIGPPLAADTLVPRLQRRLDSEPYREAIRRIDQLEDEPYRSFRGARQQVLAASGLERVRLWIQFRIIEPRFDTLVAAMPQLGLSDDEARVLAEYLVANYTPPPTTLRARATRLALRVLPRQPARRHLLLFFLTGFTAGAGVIAGLGLANRARTGRRRGRR
jgi:hypothetical protein